MKNPNTKYERLYREIDTEEFRAQIHAIVDNGYYVDRPTDYQLMIGLVNYYPGKGTITTGSVCHPKKGLEALFELLEIHRAMNITL